MLPARSPARFGQHQPQNAMSDPGEIARFYDRCSDFMRALLQALAEAPDQPRPFSEIEDSLGWPRRRIASVLGGVAHLRHTEFGGLAPVPLARRARFVVRPLGAVDGRRAGACGVRRPAGRAPRRVV